MCDSNQKYFCFVLQKILNQAAWHGVQTSKFNSNLVTFENQGFLKVL